MIKQLTFNPITAKLDEVSSIPELSSDPAANAGDAWVLRSGSGGSGGGKINFIAGLGMLMTTQNSGGAFTYKFSYRTNEGTTVRTTLS